MRMFQIDSMNIDIIFQNYYLHNLFSNEKMK